MKKYHLKKWVKYLLLFMIDGIFCWNAPHLIRNANTINDFRHNVIVVFILIMINTLAIIKIEKRKEK